MTKHLKKALYYDNIALLPRYSSLESRKEADTSAYFGLRKFKLPVIPSNMKCVMDEERAEWLSKNNYMYVMHRFDISNYKFVKKANIENWKTISVSIGVKQEDYDFLNIILAEGLRVDFITIDIAHGHCKLMKDIIEFIRPKFDNTVIIAGNVATPEGFDDLSNWGADAIKVGIGPGAACFCPGTKVRTSTGSKNIEDIKVGEYVLTHTNKYEKVINTLNFDASKFDIYQVNDIQCTHNHEFLVVEKIYADIITNENYLDYAKWIPAEELSDKYLLIEL
jgi:hypothetical protein